MSEATIRGTIKNFSPKPQENYYGLLVDDGQDEKWLNGSGNPDDSWNKGDRAKIKVNKDEFIDIQNVEILEGGQNKDGGSRGSKDQRTRSNAGRGEANDSGTKSAPPLTFQDKKILVQNAAKQAKDIMLHEDEEMDESLTQGEKLEVMEEYTNGIYNMMEAQIKDKVKTNDP